MTLVESCWFSFHSVVLRPPRSSGCSQSVTRRVKKVKNSAGAVSSGWTGLDPRLSSPLSPVSYLLSNGAEISTPGAVSHRLLRTPYSALTSSDWRIILLFTLGGVLIVVFALWEIWLDERALIPMSILKNRTEVASSIAL